MRPSVISYNYLMRALFVGKLVISSVFILLKTQFKKADAIQGLTFLDNDMNNNVITHSNFYSISTPLDPILICITILYYLYEIQLYLNRLKVLFYL